MDIATIGTVSGITVICYVVGMACKASEHVKDELIPVIMAVIGGALGVVGMYIMPDFPVHDIINALAVGAVSGLAATGAHQAYKQSKK